MPNLIVLTSAAGQTLYMTFISTLLACLVGFPLGLGLFTLSPTGIRPCRNAYKRTSCIIRLFRSVPFIILMILLFRVFRFIAPGETWTSVIAPLTISAIPFVTQTVENAFARVNLNIIHAARAMGSTDFQIVKKVLIPEALSGLISGLTLTIINLLGYSAAAGALWGCGLGGLIIQSNVPLTAAAGVIILLLIESVQILGALATRNIAISK